MKLPLEDDLPWLNITGEEEMEDMILTYKIINTLTQLEMINSSHYQSQLNTTPEVTA